MNDPATFSDSSARHALPHLFAGQAQKEFTVNEALAKIDMLLHPVVEGQVTSEPASPVAGECVLVGGPASGAFTGHEDRLASWDGQQWTFTDPVAGMTVYDRTAGTRIVYLGGWQDAPSVSDPTGGSTIDSEARGAIVALANALRSHGIIS